MKYNVQTFLYSYDLFASRASLIAPLRVDVAEPVHKVWE